MAAAEMVRVNTRISKTLNEWLDKQSEETGVPKSTMIFLALENYKQQHETLKAMGGMSSIMERLDDLQKAIQDTGKQS